MNIHNQSSHYSELLLNKVGEKYKGIKCEPKKKKKSDPFTIEFQI